MKQYQLTKNRSKKQSLKKILFGSVVFVGLSVGTTQNSYAFFGIGPTIVINPTGMAQWVEQTATQLEQYSTQLETYETVFNTFKTDLENLLAIGAFVWTEAHTIIKDVQSLDDIHSIYQLVYGSIGDAMKAAQSFDDFNNNPCSAFYPVMGEAITSSSSFPYHCHYTKTGKAYGMPPIFTALAHLPLSTSSLLYALPSTPPSLLSTINVNPNIEDATLNMLREQGNDSAIQTKLNTSETQLNLQQQSDLQNDADNIDIIQNLKTSGNLQALQKQNQLAGNIATQLMKLRALTMAKNAAEAQKREEETQEKAKAEAFYYQIFLTDSYAPMKKHVWK